MNITLKDFQNDGNVDSDLKQSITISRQHEDLANKIAEHDITDLKIGLKIFLQNDDQQCLSEALDKGKVSFKKLS